MQTADAFSVATPADWHPGDDVIVPLPDLAMLPKNAWKQRGDALLRLVLLHEETRQRQSVEHCSEEIALLNA